MSLLDAAIQWVIIVLAKNVSCEKLLDSRFHNLAVLNLDVSGEPLCPPDNTKVRLFSELTTNFAIIFKKS
jgi:hypothetical protein